MKINLAITIIALTALLVAPMSAFAHPHSCPAEKSTKMSQMTQAAGIIQNLDNAIAASQANGQEANLVFLMEQREEWWHNLQYLFNCRYNADGTFREDRNL